jgi:hypothetical protein
MDNSKIDAIQAQPPERPPAEIQAHAPQSRLDDSPVQPCNLQGWSWWPPDWVLLLIVGLGSLYFVVEFLGGVTNKTFNHVSICGSFPDRQPQVIDTQKPQREEERRRPGEE